jgi:hypothetical protein
MAITLGTNTITGIAAGGLPDGIITTPLIGYAGAILQVQQIQTRTQASYSAPVITAGTGLTNAGTEIAILTISITPKKAGNKIILEWMLNGEGHWDTTYIVTRDGAIMSNAADANRWSGMYNGFYESAGDVASTPHNDRLIFIDNSSLSTTTTYRLHTRASGGTARTLWVNSAYNSRGADNYEAGVSTVTATEINV